MIRKLCDYSFELVGRIKNLLDPVDPQDATTKAYVDTADGGLQSQITLNNNKVSADGSIDTHSDVDVSTSTPIAGQTLTYDGTNFVPTTPPTGVTDHGVLTGLADDDHLQYLTEARHDALPSDNPHNVDKTQVGLGNVDNTSDVNKPISTATQTALDLKADQAALDQEISDRTTADAAIQLQLDNHEANISNPHQVTITQAVAQDTGTDITTAELEELSDGSETVLHKHPLPFYEFSKVTTVNLNEGTALLPHNTLNVTIPELGNYEIEVSYIWSTNSGSTDFVGELKLGATTLARHVQEPKDTAGTGVVGIRLDGGASLNTSTDQRHPATLKDVQNLAAGAQTITFEFAASSTTDRPAVYQSLIIIRRVS